MTSLLPPESVSPYAEDHPRARTSYGVPWYQAEVIVDYGEYHDPDAVEALATVAYAWDCRVDLSWHERPDWRQEYGAEVERRALYGVHVYFSDPAQRLLYVAGRGRIGMHAVPMERVCRMEVRLTDRENHPEPTEAQRDGLVA